MEHLMDLPPAAVDRVIFLHFLHGRCRPGQRQDRELETYLAGYKLKEPQAGRNLRICREPTYFNCDASEWFYRFTDGKNWHTDFSGMTIRPMKPRRLPKRIVT